jgi:sugar lactone lactonase YvrE
MGGDAPAPICEHRFELGEGPQWDPDTGALLNVDIRGGLVHRHVAGRCELREIETPLGAVALRRGGGLVAALRDDLALLGPDGAVERRIGVDASPETRFNDGRVDSQGRFWAGTMSDEDETSPVGALYRLDPDGHVETMLTGVALANGLDWSPDDRTFYFTETARGVIHAFAFDASAGTIGDQRVFADFGDETPDGLCVDAEGGVWVAFYGGGRVRRLRPDGRVAEEHLLPVPYTTSCAIGADGALYVTTARGDSDDPRSGAVFRLALDAAGRPARRFGG